MPTDIAIKVADQAIQNALASLMGALENTAPAMLAISETLLDSVEEGFDEEASPETGAAWKDLSPATIAQRTKKGSWPGKMLQVSQGGLASSWHSEHSAFHAVAGSNKPYAAIHHFGGMAGKNRKVKIPARPHAQLSPDHKIEVINIISRHLDTALR